MQKSNTKNVVDDDDLPPELEELPDELLNNKPKSMASSGNATFGDITEIKEEKSLPVPVETEKKEFGGMLNRDV
jgi:hypothetical protein